MIDLKQIYPLADFQRKAKAHIARLKKTGQPSVLTVNGQAELVMLSAQAFQKLINELEMAENLASIHKGMLEAQRGEGLTVDEAFRQIRSRVRAKGAEISMKYNITVHAEALQDIEDVYANLLNADPSYAERWMAEVQLAISKLDMLPNRCPFAPESARCSFHIRQLVVGKYRVLYAVHGNSVHVMRVRHLAQGPLDPKDLN